jgi:predicted dehydrogenase
VFDPVKLRADGSRVTVGVPDQLSLVAEFPGPVLATMELSTGAAFDERLVQLRGTGGTLRVDFSSNRIELATGAEGYRPVEIRPGEAGEWRVEREFVDAIRGEGEVRLTDFATGAAYMAFTDAARRSALEGRRVSLGPGL